MYALAIDIGGTKTAAAIVRSDGTIRHRQRIATPAAQGAAAILQATIDLGRSVLAAATDAGIDVAGAGVGSAGQVDADRGTIVFAADTLPGWTGMPLGPALAAAWNVPVTVDNDVNVMALGEARLGAGRAYDHGLFVSVGTGVGGGLILDRRLWGGATWTAGELGHMVVDWDSDRRCSCGQSGHLEAYAAGPAIVRRYCALAGSDQPIDLQAVADRAGSGDDRARAAIEEGAHVLGTAIGGLLNVLDLPVVVIGGGVAELGEVWWTPLTAALRANPSPGPARVTIARAQLGGAAPLVGAAFLYFDRYNGAGVDR